jgi:hypothetical protein
VGGTLTGLDFVNPHPYVHADTLTIGAHTFVL